MGELFSLTPPLFNRLTVFDARIPHGVRRVEGTRDPRHGRLVLHGWFTAPSPHFEERRAADGALAAPLRRRSRRLHHFGTSPQWPPTTHVALR